MDLNVKVHLATRGTEEVITLEELKDLLEKGGTGYIGVEPSGIFHVGWLVWALKFKDLVDAGIKMILYVADWHAWINDKLGGNMDLIKLCAKHIIKVLDSLDLKGRYKVVYADDLVRDREYFTTLVKIAKASSLARIKRALTILGRRAEEGAMDFSKLVYPLMQVTDIFMMDLDLALGGIDQRKAHVLQREVAEKYGWKKVVAIHTPLIPSLKGMGRMDVSKVSKEEYDELMMEYKMSKSIPGSAIFITDSDEEIRSKIHEAYCPPRVTEGNPIIEIARHLFFRGEERALTIERETKYGGPIEVYNERELLDRYSRGEIHPLDLKNAVSEYLIKLVSPIREELLRDAEIRGLLENIMSSVTR